MGSTDEPLCPEGRAALEQAVKAYPLKAGRIYASPMKRCMETAELLFPGQPVWKQIPDFREASFGEAEYKNYQELSGEAFYQAWIDSGGTLTLPGAEPVSAFKTRCVRAFRGVLEESREVQGDIACVVHGGTIMSIMEAFALPVRPYFDWQVKNGSVIVLKYDGDLWKRERRLHWIAEEEGRS